MHRFLRPVQPGASILTIGAAGQAEVELALVMMRAEIEQATRLVGGVSFKDLSRDKLAFR